MVQNKHRPPDAQSQMKAMKLTAGNNVNPFPLSNRTWFDFMLPTKRKSSKGQPCLEPRGGISIEILTHSMKPFPLHRLNRKYELFYQRLCIIRNSLVVQCNHFSTSKSATLSRYTRTTLCRNNLFLISVLGNATVGLCWYIRSLFSWKPRATSATATQDSPAKFEKMLWIKQQWWTELFVVTLGHMHTLKGAKTAW